MKICIYGAGAIGGFLGARLGAQGHAMSAVARGATLAALRGHGMRLRIGGRELTSPVTAAADPAVLGQQDLVVVAVKEPALRDVAAHIAPLLGPATIVLTAMNGVPWWFFDGMPGPYAGLKLTALDPEGAIAAAIPAARVIGCVVHASCKVAEPGVVQHVMGQGLIIGEPAGGASPRTTNLASDLSAAGFECSVSQRIQQDIWYKLWGNMTMNPISAFTGATVDRMVADELVSGYCLAMMKEAAAVGDAIGCPITQSGEDRIEVARKLGVFKTSMLQDVEAGKALEIDALLTAVREIAGHAEIATPHLDALLGLTRLFARTRGLYPA
ncbi:MAG: 2-dehydropantoate 2-reductase [Casimicrobiaceae bacterium]